MSKKSILSALMASMLSLSLFVTPALASGNRYDSNNNHWNRNDNGYNNNNWWNRNNNNWNHNNNGWGGYRYDNNYYNNYRHNRSESDRILREVCEVIVHDPHASNRARELCEEFLQGHRDYLNTYPYIWDNNHR